MSVTHAERGLLLEADDEGVLKVRLARGSGGTTLAPESIAPSQTALRQAVSKRAAAITDDLNLDDLNLKSAQSVVIQGLRAVVAIPLYAVAHANADGSETAAGRLLGALYLDSRRTTAFSNCRPADSGRAERAGGEHSGQRAAGGEGTRTTKAGAGTGDCPRNSARTRAAGTSRIPLPGDQRHTPAMPRGGRRLLRCVPAQRRVDGLPGCRRYRQGAGCGAAHHDAARRAERHETWALLRRRSSTT